MPRKIPKKRRSAEELVSSVVPHNIPIENRLSPSDKEFFMDVVEALRSRLDISVYAVAQRVKDELGLKSGKDAIARTLKRLRDDM